MIRQIPLAILVLGFVYGGPVPDAEPEPAASSTPYPYTYATTKSSARSGNKENSWTYASTPVSTKSPINPANRTGHAWHYATPQNETVPDPRNIQKRETMDDYSWSYVQHKHVDVNGSNADAMHEHDEREERFLVPNLLNQAMDIIQSITGSSGTTDVDVNIDLDQGALGKIVGPVYDALANPPDISPCNNGMGFCTSAGRCADLGGEKIGTCSRCKNCGVCCQYTPRCEEQTSEMITHFQSVGYPQAARNPSACSLRIQVKPEVCQVRLDFIDFEMPNPVAGVCDNGAYLEIFNPATPLGALGPANSKICGLNQNQHLYLGADSGSTIVLKATPPAQGRNFAFRWNIVATQIPCRDIVMPFPSAKRAKRDLTMIDSIAIEIGQEVVVDVPEYYKQLKAPNKCHQYFTESRGTISSFNFDGTAQIATGQDMSICIKRQKDVTGGELCGIRFTSSTFSLPASNNILPGQRSPQWPAAFLDAVRTVLLSSPNNCQTGAVVQPNPANPTATNPSGTNPILTPCCTGARVISGANTAILPVNNPGTFYLGIDGTSTTNTPTRFHYCGNVFGDVNSNGAVTVTRGEAPIMLRWRTDAQFPTTVASATGQLAQCPAGSCLGFRMTYDRNC